MIAILLWLRNNWQLSCIIVLAAGLGYFYWESSERGHAIESMSLTIAAQAKANESNLATIKTMKESAAKDLAIIQTQHARALSSLNSANKKIREMQNAKERDGVAAPVLNDAVIFLRGQSTDRRNADSKNRNSR